MENRTLPPFLHKQLDVTGTQRHCQWTLKSGQSLVFLVDGIRQRLPFLSLAET